MREEGRGVSVSVFGSLREGEEEELARTTNELVGALPSYRARARVCVRERDEREREATAPHVLSEKKK